MASKFKATLIRGVTYFVGDRRADAGSPIVVTQEEKEHLEEHAVDILSTSDDSEIIQRQKFQFEAIKEEGDDGDEGEGEDGEGEGDENGGGDADKGKSAAGAAPRSRARTRTPAR